MPKVEKKLRNLNVKINLKLDGDIKYIDRRIRPTIPELMSLGKTYTKKLTSFLCTNKRTKGWANTKTACGHICGSNNIVSFSQTLRKSKRDRAVAALWAHELGHNIGMRYV